MTISELRASVDCGLCTWLQVEATLINSRTSALTRRQFLKGEIKLSRYADRMLLELINSGGVPLRVAT